MTEPIRSLSPSNISAISESLAKHRLELLNQVERAIPNTIKFSQAAATAIGDISYSEAVEGIIDFFRDEMRKVKI